jgi:diaminopimelate epimerase
MMTMPPRAELRFHKMHGAGNDFVLLDLRGRDLQIDAAHARALADRRRGIGCDQLLILHAPRTPGCIARYEIRNADGGAAGQCGNGARCIALYLAMNAEVGSEPFTLESPSGPVTIARCPDGEFEVDMGEPDFAPDRVPIRLEPAAGHYTLASPWGELSFGAVSMGNPHALVVVDDIDLAPLQTAGAFLSRHEVFPDGCNVGFAEIQDRGSIRLRVLERGAGETLACGSGACAAVALLRHDRLVGDCVTVFLPGGHLVIKWPGSGRIRMQGPAVHVFGGTISHE